MKTPVVSVIMPVFNAEKYIKEAAECILGQTLKSIELVIVDDCSTDGTWDIIQQLSKEDNRCRVFQLGQNTGSAKYPRDYAAKMSTGRFVCWIDADDKIPSNYIEQLVERQEETQADIVCSKMLAFGPDGNIVYTLPREDFDYEQIRDGKNVVMLTIGKEWQISVNGFLTKREIWTSTKYFLDKNVAQMNADDYASREMLLASNRVAFSDTEYHYRLHQQSITKAISHKLFEPLITDRMVIELFKERFGKGLQIEEAWSQYFTHWISMARIYVIRKEELPEESRKISWKLLKEHKKEFRNITIFKDKHITFQHKLLLTMPIRVSIFIIKKLNGK